MAAKFPAPSPSAATLDASAPRRWPTGAVIVVTAAVTAALVAGPAVVTGGVLGFWLGTGAGTHHGAVAKHKDIHQGHDRDWRFDPHTQQDPQWEFDRKYLVDPDIFRGPRLLTP
jgi:hypothetical protein